MADGNELNEWVGLRPLRVNAGPGASEGANKGANKGGSGTELQAVAMAVDHTRRCWRELHERYTICATLAPRRGRSHGTIRYRGRDHEVVPGQVHFMEPGEVHVTKSLDGTASFRLLQVTPQVMADMIGGSWDDHAHFRGLVLDAPALAHRFASALTRAMQNGDAAELGPVLCDLVATARERPPRRERNRTRHEVERVARALRARYQDHPTLDELADDVGLTRFRLVQLFSRDMGLPPMQYLLTWRLGMARQQLAAGTAVTAAAHEAGFYDHSQFCRQFRRAFGITPSAYRDAVSHTRRPTPARPQA